MKLQPLGTNRWKLPRTGAMRVEAVVYMSDDLLADSLEDGALQQLADAAQLPGVREPVLGMPDLHQGYGLPILYRLCRCSWVRYQLWCPAAGHPTQK